MSSKQNFSYECSEDVETYVENILKDCRDSRSIRLFVDDILNDMEGIEKRRQNLFRSFQGCNPYNTNNLGSRNCCNALHSLKCTRQNGNTRHFQNIDSTPTNRNGLPKSTWIPKPQTSSIPSNCENSKSDNPSKELQVSQPMLVEVRKPIQQDNNLQILVNIKYPNSKNIQKNNPSSENLPQSLKTTESPKRMNFLQNSQISYPCLSKTQERLSEIARPCMTSYKELQMHQQEHLQPSDDETKCSKYKNELIAENTKYLSHRNEQTDTLPQGLNSLEVSIKLQQPEDSQIPENAKYMNYMSKLKEIPYQSLKQSEYSTELQQPEESQIRGNTQYKNLKNQQTDNSPQVLKETEIPAVLPKPKVLQTPKNTKSVSIKSKPSDNVTKNLKKPESNTDLQQPNTSPTPEITKNKGKQRAKSPQVLKKTEFSTELPEPKSLQIPKNTKSISTKGKQSDNLTKDLKQSESATALQQPNESQLAKSFKCMNYRHNKPKNPFQDISPTATPLQEPEDENITKHTHCTGCDCMKPLFLLLQNQRDGSLHLESFKKLASQQNWQATQDEHSSLFKTQNRISELLPPRVPARSELQRSQPEFLQLSDDIKYCPMYRDIQIPNNTNYTNIKYQNPDDVTQGVRWSDKYTDLSFTLNSNNP